MKIFPALAVLLLAAPAFAENKAAAALHALFARDWDRQMHEDPLNASAVGDLRFNDRWADRSMKAIEASAAADRQALKDLAAIDRAALSQEDQVSYDLFQWQQKDALDSFGFHEYVFAVNQMGGLQTAGDAAQHLRFENVKDYEDWLQRMRTLGPLVDQTIELLRLGIAEKRTLPRFLAKKVSAQFAEAVSPSPEKINFYEPFLKFPASVGAAARAQLKADAAKTIAGAVLPAMKRAQKFWDETYVPACRDTLAARDLPDGKNYYAYLVRHFTTTDLTPDQAHQLGLKRVAEIRAQMDDVIKQTGFKGSFKEFLAQLRTDPKFYYRDADSLLTAYRAEAKLLDALLPKEFGREPRVPWGVDVIPADSAPNQPTAYENPPPGDGTRAALVSVNLYKPETRPKYEIPVLMCHEGRPGHALQTALSAELTGLPDFRRYAYFNAYGEGWGLYSETLCDEMGAYDDPYKKFGELEFQMWRAGRLVVDTGLHDEGMTRDEAIKVLEDNTALSRHNIEAEIDRYISWPGQALCYMVGELKIQELRARAEKRLGAKFDVRAFHDAVLEGGSLPLQVLDASIERWISAREAR